jgi:hypothetical protein
MRCSTNNKGTLTYFKAEKKENNKMDYKQWISIVREFTPPLDELGKTYRQIRREGNIPLKSAPALWVRQAKTDIGLTRKIDSKTHRILWTRSQTYDSHIRFIDSTLNELIRKNEIST